MTDENAINNADEIIEVAAFDAEGLIGQVGDFLLSELKGGRELKSWAAMPESEQRDVIDRAGRQARSIVGGIVRAVRSNGLPSMSAKIEGGSFKDGFFQIKATAMMTAENAEILASKGADVQIVFASLEEFEGDMEAKPEPDQKVLIREGVAYDAATGEVLNDTPVFDQTKAGEAAAA